MRAHKINPLTLRNLEDGGCTREFKELIASGQYVDILEKLAAKMAIAAQKHGIDSVVNPTVRIGTCHSAKGMESDHVILLNRIPYPTVRSCETEEGLKEESRVWYVSATRARHRLTIAEGEGEVFAER